MFMFFFDEVGKEADPPALQNDRQCRVARIGANPGALKGLGFGANEQGVAAPLPRDQIKTSAATKDVSLPDEKLVSVTGSIRVEDLSLRANWDRRSTRTRSHRKPVPFHVPKASGPTSHRPPRILVHSK